MGVLSTSTGRSGSVRSAYANHPTRCKLPTRRSLDRDDPIHQTRRCLRPRGADPRQPGSREPAGARSGCPITQCHRHRAPASRQTRRLEPRRGRAGHRALPGTVSVSFELGPTITGRFTIHTHGGSITGTGSAKLHSSGLYASFGGTMSVSHGTGRYSHAHGHGGFYGTVNRHTYAAVIQTTGTLSY